MKIYRNQASFKATEKTYITIGTFDGVHIGHQKVLKTLIDEARENKTTPLLLTFFPHPRMVLQQDVELKLINTLDERIQLLESTGLEQLFIHPFSKDFARLSALDFVRSLLVNTLHVSKLFIGYDHHFGKNREGNYEQLEDYAHTYDFEVSEISEQDIDNIAVSSTKIRKALDTGDIERANRYLGYPFMLTGTVVKGKSLGKTIGFPTANLYIEESYKLIPKTGAYIVQATIDQRLVYGMMNIGYKPTLGGDTQTIEIHFFNLQQDLYGQKIQVQVLKFLRAEEKFNSVEALKKQLQTDRLNAQSFIKQRKPLHP
ncbi:MAG: bifunctional riboflavin kinase/FAD synthetase [Lutibacter sp.]|nr:bifunctional riboflavin kinase/FAD synthetase [Lutibacter sp.]